MSITFPFIFPNLGFSFDTAGPSIENKDVTQQSASETTDCFECVVCLFFSFLSKIIYCTERVIAKFSPLPCRCSLQMFRAPT